VNCRVTGTSEMALTGEVESTGEKEAISEQEWGLEVVEM
jgi:hypothetical protein